MRAAVYARVPATRQAQAQTIEQQLDRLRAAAAARGWGRHARLRAGTLLPWTRPPFGCRLDPDRPRDAAAVRTEPAEAALVAQLSGWYLEPQATLYQLTGRLAGLGAASPAGKPRWTVASVRGILRNPAY